MGNEQSTHYNVTFSSLPDDTPIRLRFRRRSARIRLATRNPALRRGTACLTRRIESPQIYGHTALATRSAETATSCGDQDPMPSLCSQVMQPIGVNLYHVSTLWRTIRSSAKEHEPDDAKDQDRQPRRGREQSKHRRSRFGLTGISRSFDDLLVLSCYHGALDSAGVTAFRREV